MKTITQILLVIFGFLFIATSCERDDNGYWISYYKTIGEGYIYDGTNNKPLKGAKITVKTVFKGSNGGWFSTKTYSETFVTDANGYYKVNFRKRGNNDKAVRYFFVVDVVNCLPKQPPYWNRSFCNQFPDITVYAADLKGKSIIAFDTVKYYVEIN